MILIANGHTPEFPGRRLMSTSGGKISRVTTEFRECELIVGMLDSIGSDRIKRVAVSNSESRADSVNFISPACYIEFHLNWNNFERGKGCRSYYKPECGNSKLAAEFLLLQLSRIIRPNLGASIGVYRETDTADFIFQKVQCPAVILMPEYLYNADILSSKRKEIVHIIYDALLEIDS